jgi:hypothetical protein
MGHDPSTSRYALRDLPLAARLVLSAFLLSVGLGYTAALVQLHFKHAKKGELFPNAGDTIRIFHGDVPKTRIEQLIDADPSLPFDKTGQMRAAFTGQSEGWTTVVRSRAKKLARAKLRKRDVTDEEGEEFVEEAKEALRKERDGERLVMLAWVKTGANEQHYEQNAMPLPADWHTDQPLTKDYIELDGKTVRIRALFNYRCARCHGPDGEKPDIPLDSFAAIQKFLVVKNTRMDLGSLAQTTHVHLLGFSMLYGLTGLILAFSSYPLIVRCFLCPLPLVAQVVDIACWWLAREAKPYGPMFASVIPITGGIVAAGLLLHIVLSVFNMFGNGGKLMLVLLFAAAGAGGYYYVKPIVMTEIHRERDEAAAASQPAPEATKKPDDNPDKKPEK